MGKKLSSEQIDFLDQKRKDCGVQLHIGIPCIEVNDEDPEMETQKLHKQIVTTDERLADAEACDQDPDMEKFKDEKSQENALAKGDA